jgi:hypothetical protein
MISDVPTVSQRRRVLSSMSPAGKDYDTHWEQCICLMISYIEAFYS